MRARRSLAQFALVIAAAVAAPADSGELIPVKNTTALGVTIAGPTTIETTSIGAGARGPTIKYNDTAPARIPPVDSSGDSEATACARPVRVRVCVGGWAGRTLSRVFINKPL